MQGNMNLFYSTKFIDQSIVLEDQEANHCIKSLRHKQGDVVHVVDGHGNLYKTNIEKIVKNQVFLAILETDFHEAPANLPIIAISPIKNSNRYEWFIEKAVELGVGSIIPILCQRTEKRNFRMDRAKKIAVSAMKQSGRRHLPSLNDPMNFNEFVREERIGHKFICHFDESNQNLSSFRKNDTQGTLLIGPEGDFTPEEVETAISHGFVPVNLSSFRLRTETAGLVAIMKMLD